MNEIKESIEKDFNVEQVTVQTAEKVMYVTLIEHSKDLTQSNVVSNATEIGDISDGFHTFNQLYDYRMVYNAMLMNEFAFKDNLHGEDRYHCYKSKRHEDGELCFGGGWFVVSMTLPTGTVTNHYELKYWDLFKVNEKEKADHWDGHTPKDALMRMVDYILK